jgi:hypothetical protein
MRIADTPALFQYCARTSANCPGNWTRASDAPKSAGFRILKQRHSRYWEVRAPADELVCITVYKKGAAEVARQLAA